jgi:hypothetical protein
MNVTKIKENLYKNNDLLFCAIIVFIINIIYPNWFYYRTDFVTEVDSWAYLGMVIDPIAQRHGFPTEPATELLPVYWPQHIFFLLFGAVVGKCLFKSVALFVILCAILRSAKDLFGHVYAWLACFLMLTNGFFIPRLISDYATGSVILYLAVILYLVITSSRKSNIFKLLLMGFMLSCMLSSAVLTIVYFPAIAVLYYGLKKIRQNSLIGKDDIYIAAGFIASVILFSLVCFSYSGSLFYFENTYHKIFNFLGNNRDEGPPNLLNYLWAFPCYMIFIYACFYIVYYIVIKRSLNSFIQCPRISSAGLIIISALLCGFSLFYLGVFRHQACMVDPAYFTQLLPLISLALVAIAYTQFGELTRSKNSAVIGAVVTSIIMMIWCRNLVAIELPMIIVMFFVVIVMANTEFLKLPNINFKKNKYSDFLFLFLFSLSSILVGSIGLSTIMSPGIYELWSPTGWLSSYQVTVRDPVTNEDKSLPRKDVFLGVVDWMKFMDKVNPDRTALFWFDITEPFGMQFYYYNLAGFFYQDALINERFPLVEVPEHDWHGPKYIHAKPGQEIIIATSLKVPKMQQLNNILAASGMRYEILYQYHFVSGKINFDVFKIKLFPL